MLTLFTRDETGAGDNFRIMNLFERAMSAIAIETPKKILTSEVVSFAHLSVTDLVKLDLVGYFALHGGILTSLAPGVFLETPW